MRNLLAPHVDKRVIYTGMLESWEQDADCYKQLFVNVKVWPDIRQEYRWADIEPHYIYLDHLWVYHQHSSLGKMKDELIKEGHQLERLKAYFLTGKVYWYTRANNSCDLSITSEPHVTSADLKQWAKRRWRRGDWAEMRSEAEDLRKGILEHGKCYPSWNMSTWDFLALLDRIIVDIDKNLERLCSKTTHERKQPRSYHSIRSKRKSKSVRNSGFA